MQQRLTLMHDVARWKWNEGQPITDPKRDRELLQSVVERGRGKGLDPDLVRAFFTAQMEAARLVQQADSDRWKAKQQRPFADKSLAVLRQRIDDLNRELIDALAEDSAWLSGGTVQQALPQRAEDVPTGNALAGVRETAIAPLRVTSLCRRPGGAPTGHRDLGVIRHPACPVRTRKVERPPCGSRGEPLTFLANYKPSLPQPLLRLASPGLEFYDGLSAQVQSGKVLLRVVAVR
jgi:chorismate mutase-like protein